MTNPNPPGSTRPLDAAWIGGVCAGLAAQLGWPVLVVRAAFVILGAVGLIGVLVYLVLWLLMPGQRDDRRPLGLESHARTGMRSVGEVKLSGVDAGAAFALALVGGGLLWLVQVGGWGLRPFDLLAGSLAAVGLGLVWWQADRTSTREVRTGKGWRRLVAPLARGSAVVIVLVGLVLLAAAVVALSVAQTGLTEVGRLLLLVGSAIAALVLAVLPWLLRVRRALAQAQQDALLADARADMAAHLHDSVLQTLALIQRQAADPKKVTALARRQERELRQWLYGEEPASGSLVEALTEEMLDVESDHGVDVELVSVGDAELTGELSAIVRAAREAMVNAAKHSGAERIDVYAEVDPDLVSVYIRDRGVGFDLAEITDDRMGVRGSITERVKRAGGRAIIKTAPGQGTEVRLEVPR
ncbi:MAG: histidine kinase [Actinobacteria bacterium HGW-Actinobacteria-2]|nr:MAG: histidine kinase [Actinobacteria bacterium HGW-Actinobacteria-2]